MQWVVAAGLFLLLDLRERYQRSRSEAELRQHLAASYEARARGCYLDESREYLERARQFEPYDRLQAEELYNRAAYYDPTSQEAWEGLRRLGAI